MPIPEAQLDTWASQGSITQSASTRETIANALDNASMGYTNKKYEIFLQGSYGNDTNIYAESDVDIVFCVTSSFYHDISSLPDDQKDKFRATHSDANYNFSQLKADVLQVLSANFNNVAAGSRAIKIPASDSRRSVDVIAAFQYRRYSRFNAIGDEDFTPGIAFYNSSGVRIINYPKQHSENLTAKHQATNGNFKHAVRIFKNMRRRLVEEGKLAKGIAPSYFIEGLLYNVENSCFIGTSWQVIVRQVLEWLNKNNDRSKFVTASRQHWLIREGEPVCWPAVNCQAFIGAVTKLWNDW
jgi:hypothetical protein